MCQFAEVMEGLKSSSNLSVANDKFSAFNKYMHVPSKMDDRLKGIIEDAKGNTKSLVLVCGNSGDGKSHLIANFIEKGIIKLAKEFDVYIDATSSDRKGMRANEKLREKLDEFSDEKLGNGVIYRLIVAINLGVLNDFIKNYENEYKVLKKYIDDQGLFDNIPAWKYKLMEQNSVEQEKYYLGHVDFTSFHRYEIGDNGIDATFITKLFEKVVSNVPGNTIYEAFDKTCKSCPNKSNCSVYWNYFELTENKKLREYIVNVLIRAIIKGNLAPSVREIDDFIYEIIIGRTFEESEIMSKSVNRLTHFIQNTTLNLMFENYDGLMQYTSKEDVLGLAERRCDTELIALNLKPDFETWLMEEAIAFSPVYSQIRNDILFCKHNLAKRYKEKEQEIKQTVYKLFIRMKAVQEPILDEKYENYLKLLYYYNAGMENKCKELIQLVEECVYLWNGRLGDKSGNNIKTGVIVGRSSARYYLYKKMEVSFAKNTNVVPLNQGEEFPNFSSTMRFGFKLKDKINVIMLDIDYELYSFLLEVKAGYVPTNSDKKKNVKYDTFVRKIIAESDSDTYVYSRIEDGKTYRISKDDFGDYKFDYEV